MDSKSIGSFDITLDVIGHDAASYTIILKLPSGSIIPATISRANFNKHMVPLFENPPEKVVRPAPQMASDEIKAVAEASVEEIKKDKDDLWWDVDAMFQEIRWHAKNNHRNVVLDVRDITPQRLAFKCIETQTTWSVDMQYMYAFLDKLSASSNKEEQSRAFQLRKCVSTADGKQRLVESLNKAIG